MQDRCTQEVHRKMASLLIVSVGNCKVFAEISPASCVVSVVSAVYSLCDECGLNISGLLERESACDDNE